MRNRTWNRTWNRTRFHQVKFWFRFRFCLWPAAQDTIQNHHIGITGSVLVPPESFWSCLTKQNQNQFRLGLVGFIDQFNLITSDKYKCAEI